MSFKIVLVVPSIGDSLDGFSTKTYGQCYSQLEVYLRTWAPWLIVHMIPGLQNVTPDGNDPVHIPWYRICRFHKECH